MVEERARDRFLDALGEMYEALLSVADKTELRGHRVLRQVFEDARKGEREVLTLARRMADAPTSYLDNLSAIIDAQTRAELHALELARQALDATDEYRKEVQHALQRAIRANRAAAEAAVELTRAAAKRATRRVREVPRPHLAHPRPVRPRRVPAAETSKAS